MLIEVQQLQQVMTELPADKAAQYAPLLSKWCEVYEINTPRRIAAFLATIAEESGELRHWRENLNYSAERLVEVWPRRFPNLALAKQYERNPRKLANFIYTSFSDKAKELGNRPNSDDGWLYRGGGPGQATGRQMYADLTAAVGEKLGVDLVKNPERIEEPEIGIAATCWIWSAKRVPVAIGGGTRHESLNWLAEQGGPVAIRLKGRPVKMPPFQAITRLWNGGEVGLRSRMAYLVKATSAMEVNKV